MMRADELRRWRSRATILIVLGLLGGIVLGGFAVFWGAASGMATMGCGGSSGCEQRTEEDGARANRLLYLALFGGGGLIAVGVATKVATARRLRDFESNPLPAAKIVQRPESGRDLP